MLKRFEQIDARHNANDEESNYWVSQEIFTEKVMSSLCLLRLTLYRFHFDLFIFCQTIINLKQHRSFLKIMFAFEVRKNQRKESAFVFQSCLLELLTLLIYCLSSPLV